MQLPSVEFIKVPPLTISDQHQKIKSEIFEAFEKVYDRSAFTDDTPVIEFETEFAKFCNTKYAVAVNNGTSALHLALLALNIGPGDEVILPANTHISTAWAISYTQAIPVFVDCTDDTWQICSNLEEKITFRTRVIIGVHLYGQPCDIGAIQEICKKKKLHFLEDASHAHGAKYKNVPVGSFGEMACFSFNPGHNMAAFGEAGVITTNNKQYFKRLISLRNNGSVLKYYHDEIGYNMRMGILEATSLKIKLKYLKQWNNRRKQIAKKYMKYIKNDKIQFQLHPNWSDSVYHLFVITTEDRDKLVQLLNRHDISAELHYPIPCHMQKPYRDMNNGLGDCPNTEYLATHCLSLPMYPEMKEDKIDLVIKILNSY